MRRKASGASKLVGRSSLQNKCKKKESDAQGNAITSSHFADPVVVCSETRPRAGATGAARLSSHRPSSQKFVHTSQNSVSRHSRRQISSRMTGRSP
eukprot:3105587-Rhodomonas_salina.2